MPEKVSFDYRKKRSNNFLPLGVPLCALALQIAAFGRKAKAKETLKN